MPFYIKDKELGLFVGGCLGLGFYESHIKDGTLDPREEAFPFASREEAQEYMDSWNSIPEGTEIIFKVSAMHPFSDRLDYLVNNWICIWEDENAPDFIPAFYMMCHGYIYHII